VVVTGLDLKKRIVRIVNEQVVHELDFSNKLLLRVARLAAVVMPFVLGMGHPIQGLAQTSPDNQIAKVPIFAVVSVKQNRSSDQSPSFNLMQDGVSAKNNSLMWLIEVAYGIDEERMISGAPNWIKSENYDVEAKVSDSDVAELAKLSRKQRGFMLQAVLEDRFRLKYHFETKDILDFALVVAKNGPKFSESKPIDPTNPVHLWKITGRYQLSAQGVSMAELSYLLLSTEAQHFVVDKTGLTGKYDFTLAWTREDVAQQQSDASATDSSGPSIFSALQSQLGLKLVPIKVATKILVIDNVERPSAN
jgi:bla regulator protein blaR1